MTSTALVTGAGGFLGSHVVETLLARTDWRVVAVDSFRHNGAVDKLLEVSDYQRVTPVSHDLTVPFSPTQLDRIGWVDHVVNVASRSSVAESISEPAEFVTNNVQLALTVLEFVRSQPHATLLHMSTDEIYGPHDDVLATTDHRPSSPYAASKAMQEDLVHAYGRTYGVPVTIVNSANMFGERQSQLAFIPRVIRALIRGEKLAIHTHQGIVGLRRYVYVKNVAELIVDRLTGRVSNDYLTVSGRLQVNGQVELDNLSVAQLIADQFDLPLSYALVDASVSRPGYDPAYPQMGAPELPMRYDFIDGLRSTITYAVNQYRQEVP